MSAESAIQTATLLQQKVGNSLSGVTNLLAPPERSDSMLNAGAASLPTLVLDEVKELQKKTIESVDKVAQVLQSQLDLAKEAERRARDQAAELAKEKGGTGVIAGGVGDVTVGDDITDEKLDDLSNKLGMSTILTAGLGTALLSKEALKNFGKKLGGRLLKGGIFGAIAGYVADPIVDYVNKEFDLELDADAKQDIKMSMIGAGVGFGVAGIPGAIIGATVPMISRVAQYIGGSLNADEISDADFAGAAIGTAAAGMFTASKLGPIFAGSTIPKVATFGAALGSLPVLIGIGAAVAVGAGAMFIAKKIDEYQEMTLKKLAQTTAKLDKEMGEWAAREEEGLFERFGINLGQLSALGEAKVATQEAMEQMGQNKEKFMADTGTQTKLIALADTIAGYSDDAIKTILLDRTKANNFFDTVESIKGIAAQGGFGEASQDVFTKMAAFSDNVQRVAKAQVAIGETGGVTKLVADNTFARGGDKIELAAELQPKVEELLKKQAEAQEVLRLATLVRQAEDEEQRKTFLGKIGDLGFNTDLEKAELQAKRDLVSITSQLNKANDTLQGLGVNFNFDQLKETFAGNEKGLQELIMRSVTGRGQDFLQEQQAATNRENASAVMPISYVDNKKQTNVANSSQVIKKLSVDGDFYHDRIFSNVAVV